MSKQTYQLPANFKSEVDAALKDWHQGKKTQRLWARDASLWTGRDEGQWLGWLGATEKAAEQAKELKAFAEKIKQEKFTHVLLLGMGGSSLCPEVLMKTFGKKDDYPELHVLDSTDPAQIKSIEKKINITRTLFIVSSKSGGTLETNIFKQYFFERAKEAQRFIAITDPKSKLQEIAERDGFRRIFFGTPSIGGRFSALSNFGSVPGAVMGIDVEKFLTRAHEMARLCALSETIENNPGVVLGVILGVSHRLGRDKVTLVSSPKIASLGAWLEQLVAESSGKNSKGLIPVDGERLSAPEAYGKDRLFVYTRLDAAFDPEQDAAMERLEKAGQPVIRIFLKSIDDLGQEFFRWEIATAVSGAILGINPFDQPDVEASKIVTKELTSNYEKTGSLPSESPIFEEDGIRLFADPKNAESLESADKTLTGYLKAHFKRIKTGDYVALLAYIEMNEAHEKILQEIRNSIFKTKRVATCLGFGPRFLHSTGQAYKGGPNSGVFLQVTCDDAQDFLVPGQKYTFGVVKAAQARGDFQVLADRGRRALRAHLSKDVAGDLKKLQHAINQAL